MEVLMPDTYTVTRVNEYHPNPYTECWQLMMLKPDGFGHGYLFPKATLEYRAGEYGIDPEDTETLLDIVLHEPFLPDLSDPASHTSDPAWQLGVRGHALHPLGRIRAGDMVPADLWTASTIDDARTAHLARIDHVKSNIVRVTSAVKAGMAARGGDPLDLIRAHPIDPDGVKRHAALVHIRRQQARGARFPAADLALAAPRLEVPRA
jgi:hypothetical protein